MGSFKFLKIGWSVAYVAIIGVWVYITFLTKLFVVYSEKTTWYVTNYHNQYAFIFWLITFLAPFLIGLVILVKKLKNADGVLREKIWTFWWLLLVSIAGGFFFDVFLTGIHQYQYNNIGPFFSLPFDLGIASLIYSRKNNR